MPSEESIRTDASTVHRIAESHDGGDAASMDVAQTERPPNSEDRSNDAVKPLGVEDGDIVDEQAKTVIRGSSREQATGPRTESVNRTPAAVAQILLGQRLNHFLLEELIGGGGMGAVFRAHDEQLDRTVAIKVIPFVGNDPDLQRRFRNEAQSAAKLDHPRIARVFDAGRHDEWHYIVFEYIEGTNIRDLVNRDGVMSVDDAVFYTSQLAGALQHAADRGIVHRDIKPSNVLIGSEGKLKLVDMGLARSDNIDLSEDMTASGVTLGTFDYISPEQAHDPRQADLRSDIYSLGCTLYFMLTGRPPYPGGTMLQKLLSHGNAPPPDARDFRPEISEDLSVVIRKMLAKNPRERYQTGTDLIADLREVAFRDGLVQSQTLNPVSVTQLNPLAQWLEKHAPWMVAAACMVAVAGWLQLESAALRQDPMIPADARRPTLVVSPPSRSIEGKPTSSQSEALDETSPASPRQSDTVAEESRADLPRSASMQTEEAADDPRPAESASSGDPELEIADAAQPSRFEPAERPPRLSSVQPPPELSEPAISDLAAEASPMTTQPDVFPSFTIRTPFFDGFEDVSVEPLDSPVPHVIRLVGFDVGPGDDRDPDGAALASTLSRAIELAALYEVERIEISVPEVISEPVTIASDLAISSTISGGSTIRFQGMDSVAMERSRMIVVGSHQLELDHLHLVWNVPSGDIDGGTLFELNENRLVRLTNCLVTVNNATRRDEVYAFDVVTDPEKLSRQRRLSMDEFPLVKLELENVIVRGQITMLHMDYAAKLRLYWENGLLSVTDYMIDTAGALKPPEAIPDPILLSLDKVTAHAPRGLVRMRVGVSGAYPVPIDRFARKSVFVVDAGTPHFEFSGLETTESQRPWVKLFGASNAYAVDASLEDPILRIVANDSQVATSSMEDFFLPVAVWEDETSPRWAVKWATGRTPDGPASKRTPADYRQEDVSPSGLDGSTLPTIETPGGTEQNVSSVRSAQKNGGNRE